MSKSSTPQPVDVLTFLFKTADLEKLIHPKNKNAPDYIMIKSTLQGGIVDGKKEAILKVFAKGLNKAASERKANPTEVSGCPVPPCVTS